MRRGLDGVQRKDPRYRVKPGKGGVVYLNHFQKAFIGNILRDRLGGKFVAMRIWTVGLPRMCREEKMTASNRWAWRRGVEQLVDWFAKLAHDVVQRRKHEAFDPLRRASTGCDPATTRRRELRRAAHVGHHRGKRLREEIDTMNIVYDRLSDRDQKLTQNYDTGRSVKRMKFFKGDRLPAFRSTI